jgi:predicted acylesterase/phospholipase RssA
LRRIIAAYSRQFSEVEIGQVRIGLTISGAVSLGAFEGGALAALIGAVQVAQPSLRIDAIGGASAGAITAVAAARTLTGGLDPVWVMQEAWVKRDSMQALLKGANLDAPLSMQGLQQMAAGVLSPSQSDPSKSQSYPVRIQLALTNLRGFDYEIHRLQAGGNTTKQPIKASTYLDWADLTFSTDSSLDAFLQPLNRSPVDTGLASGANEFGFPPKQLSRTAADYQGQGLVNFPDQASAFWYTDGGTIDNEPLGRTLNLTNEIDAADELSSQDRRLHILIHPFPSSPPPAADLAWADTSRQPTWLRTLLRAFSVIRAQNLYSDLRAAEKTNSRVAWQSKLQAALDELLAKMPPAEQKLWEQRLGQVVDEINADLNTMPRHRERPAKPPSDGQVPAAQVLEDAVELVTGLAGKNMVGVEVVSPYLAEGSAGTSLDQLLAGDFLFAFGGFFNEGLRRSDFALGYVCMLNWMEAGLIEYGLDQQTADKAMDEALKRFYGLEPWTEKGVAKGYTDYGLVDALK